jgi:hypothetical protein
VLTGLYSVPTSYRFYFFAPLSPFFCLSFDVVVFGRCFNCVFVNEQYCLDYDFFSPTVPKFDVKNSVKLLPMFVRKEEDLLNAKLVRFS